SLSSLPNNHGYDSDFDWDRRFLIPFMQCFCTYYKFIPLALAILLNYLILFKSPIYSKEYRRALAFYHISEFFFDIHHLILFVPYPLFPYPIFLCYGILCQLGGPPRLAMTFTGTVGVFASISLCLLIFLRMRNIVPVESRFRLSHRQSIFIIGLTSTIFILNIPGFAIFARDSDNKTQILQRPEFAWVREVPGALVFGEMFELGPLNIEIGWLSFSAFYGIVFFPTVIIHSADSLSIERKKLVHLKKKSSDNATKMLMFQLFGAVFTFFCPLFGFFLLLMFGLPTSNPNVHSCIRALLMFLFLNNSMVAISIHLLMNRTYKK
ncbi:hypothetical protein PENTCL1PPCAC_16199, partial [Pristionchus entomophagus]